MIVVTELAYRFVQALLQLLTHPFYYIGILFIILQYRRHIAFERKLFSTKLHSLLPETWRAVLWGWVGGLLASVLMALVGATIQAEAVILLWILSLLLIFIRVRYLCWAYAVGVIGVLQVAFKTIPGLKETEALQWLSGPLLELSIPAMLALVAILHFVEAIYVRRQGTRLGMPLFFESKRGKIVGGYHLQGFWPMALFLIVPLEGGGGASLPWTPLLGGDLWSGGWTIIGFPVMIGFTEMTMSRLPQDKVKISSKLLMGYAVVLLGFAYLAHLWPALTLLGAMLSIGLHEAIILYSRWEETNRTPYYVHSSKGLKILGILPGSAAEELELQVGEVLHKVNGMPVRTKDELHQAMQLNPAFCKLEVLNLAGESKFVKRAIFSDEHHQLGILLAPDQNAPFYAEEQQNSILAYFSRKLTGLLSNRSGPGSTGTKSL
ncbi:PDZ domain-containing protein [Paenibacillus silviterrae]|uniref:PDZ domain-containing protein n=1 Tax=Paenibacillus silviterrae TaxID=3242194 RepID=UPI002543E3C2|nr:PDZ domain-containing protein [Paenibacillus chinjuensis]